MSIVKLHYFANLLSLLPKIVLKNAAGGGMMIQMKGQGPNIKEDCRMRNNLKEL